MTTCSVLSAISFLYYRALLFYFPQEYNEHEAIRNESRSVTVSEVCAKKRNILTPLGRSNWEQTVHHSGICELQCPSLSAKPQPSYVLMSGYRIFS